MKRILSLLLTLVLIFWAVPFGPVIAEDTPKFSVSRGTGTPGRTVTLSVEVSGNPGVIGIGLTVGYDSSALELTEGREKDFAGAFFGPITGNPFHVTWENALEPDTSRNGTLAELVFRVREGAAPGEYPVTLAYDEDSVFNAAFVNVTFATADGAVTVPETEDPSAARAALQKEADNAPTDLTPFTAESVAAYEAALKEARDLLQDPYATKGEFEDELTRLLAARAGLAWKKAAIPGDVDNDIHITSTDARLMLQVSVGKVERTSMTIPNAADLDGDGKTTSTDARMALQFSVGKIDLGHHLVTEKGTPATCTKGGVSDKVYCADCSLQVSDHRDIPAAGHKPVTDKGKAATCTAAGLTDGSHCSVCNTVLKKQTTIAALGHKPVTDKGKAATCTSTGLTDGSHCSVCNTVLKKQETIPVTDHSFGAWKIVAQATCTKEGKQTRKCTVCGATEESKISALGHNYKNGVCTRCKEKATGASISFPSVGGSYRNSVGNTLYSICEITKIETPKIKFDHNPQQLWYTVRVAMKSTYDREGNNYSRSPMVGYKIYDEDNVVINSGTLFGESVKVGETCYAELNVYYLELGRSYRVEFLNIG